MNDRDRAARSAFARGYADGWAGRASASENVDYYNGYVEGLSARAASLHPRRRRLREGRSGGRR